MGRHPVNDISTHQGLLLAGLDGSNPLAFLAALGTLRALSLAWPDRNVKMAWTQHSAAWRPVIVLPGLNEQDCVDALFNVACHGPCASRRADGERHRDALLCTIREIRQQDEELKKNLKKKEREGKLAPLRQREAEHRTKWLEIIAPHLLLGTDTSVSPAEFRSQENKAAHAASPDDRAFADYVCALGSSIFESDDGTIEDTALRTMRGSGHQHFLSFMVNLLCEVTPDHLRKALLRPWIYDDPVQNLTMRWDPRDDARYALRWSDPSGDPTRKDSGSVLGANVLAILALPLIPTVPTHSGLQTVGFPATAGRETIWILPLWSSPIDVDTCRSLLAYHEVATRPSRTYSDQAKLRARLKALGVVQCFRIRRITVGKFRSFTPAETV